MVKIIFLLTTFILSISTLAQDRDGALSRECLIKVINEVNENHTIAEGNVYALRTLYSGDFATALLIGHSDETDPTDYLVTVEAEGCKTVSRVRTNEASGVEEYSDKEKLENLFASPLVANMVGRYAITFDTSKDEIPSEVASMDITLIISPDGSTEFIQKTSSSTLLCRGDKMNDLAELAKVAMPEKVNSDFIGINLTELEKYPRHIQNATFCQNGRRYTQILILAQGSANPFDLGATEFSARLFSDAYGTDYPVIVKKVK